MQRNQFDHLCMHTIHTISSQISSFRFSPYKENLRYIRIIIIILLIEYARNKSVRIFVACHCNFFVVLRYVTRQLFRQFHQISLYQIINYNGSLLSNLNNAMQTKQHAMKKAHSYSNRHNIF